MALTAKKVYAILKRQISDMEAKLNSPVRYRGTVATADLLPLNPDIGDMYNIESKSVYGEAGMNVAWNGVVWDTMGAPIDMSLYLTKEEAETVIQRLVTEYFEKNPVKPGATTEQAQQIEQNKTDIASLKTETGSLKEDISTKITKFYASSQGETHLADSDNGKIQDMMVYGRSEQKQYSGKNLLNPKTGTTTKNGITCTANDDGTFTLNGTATASFVFIIINNDDLKKAFGTNEELRLTGAPKGASKTGYYLQIWKNEPEVIYRDTGGGVTAKKPNASCNVAIVIVNGTVFNNVLFKPMLTTDLTATYDDFEPYTGGIPSPNPDYPQEIKSVVNPTVKVCGKNLYPDGDLIELTKSYTTDFIPVVFNRNTIYLAFECNTNTVDGKYYINMIYYDKNKQKLGSNGSASQIGEKITKIEDSSSFNGIGAGNGGTNVDLKKVSYVKIVFNIYDNTATKITYKNIVVSSTPTAYEPYHEQTVTLPYTLNAIPVSSGGNVTIDGQQYIADYVDVERGKLVRMVEKKVLNGTENWNLSERSENRNGVFQFFADANIAGALCDKAIYKSLTSHYGTFDTWYNQIRFYAHTDEMTVEEWRNFLSSNNHVIYIVRNTPVKTDLTKEEITAFKALATYYPTTNIFINSEQLDGYTVFNYPISMENGWNYVKQQIGDTRNYIYDMDARTQDTDLQAAEAYVNSEYAVALTELEV